MTDKSKASGDYDVGWGKPPPRTRLSPDHNTASEFITTEKSLPNDPADAKAVRNPCLPSLVLFKTSQA